MADKKLKSADHKKIIADLMTELAGKIKIEWIREFEAEQEAINPGSDTMINLFSYSTESLWKRSRKYTGLDAHGRIIIFRDFSHASGMGTVTVSEHINADDSISLQIEMSNMPEPYRKATDSTETFNLPSLGSQPIGKKVVDSKPKESMLDTPKPEGFGAFS